MKLWDRFLTDNDKAVFAATEFGATPQWGKRPALIVVDVNYAFCDVKPLPIIESIKRWPTSCGERGWAVIPTLVELIQRCRDTGIPVIYTTSNERPDEWNSGSWGWKNVRLSGDPEMRPEGVSGSTIVDEIAPKGRDVVIRKDKPSAFFGTPLASYLQLLGCDSIIVTGGTTSGCVRATVVDAFSMNFRCTVVEDGCFDRSESSHAISLFDIAMKYAAVVNSSDVTHYVDTLPKNQFDLPSGEGIDQRSVWY